MVSLGQKELAHWGRVTHICVCKLTIIGSDNGLSPERHQAIIWTIAGIVLIGPLVTNFSEILIEIQTFSLKKIRFKMSSAKCCSFHLGLNVLNVQAPWNHLHIKMLFYQHYKDNAVSWPSKLYNGNLHYSDVIMGTMASQTTSVTIVYWTVYSGTDQRKHQSSASLAFVWGINRWPANTPHKRPVTWKMFPFDDVIMIPGLTDSLNNEMGPNIVLPKIPVTMAPWEINFCKVSSHLARFLDVGTPLILSYPDSKDPWIDIDKTSIWHFSIGSIINVDPRVFAICGPFY